MLSLRDRIKNYASQFLDLGDQKPAECSNNQLLDSSLPYIPQNSTLDKRISVLLSSKATTQVVWALTNIPKLITFDSKSISANQAIEHREIISKYIPQLISFISSDNLFIEFHSVFCLTVISPIFQNVITKTASDILLAALNQSKNYPAIEYANLIKVFIPAVSDNFLNDYLVPLLFSMLKMNDSYQHFCGYVFSFLPFERISSQLNPNNFTQFYSSSIVATHYLPEIAKQASKSPLFGEQWFNQTLPQQLLTMANVQESIRLAATRTVMNNEYNDENKSLSMFVLNAFSWATTNCEICLTLLESANILLSKKKEKFLQKYIDVINKSIKTTNINILKKLPMIFANSPLLFSDQSSQQQLQLFKTVIRKFIKAENNSESYISTPSSTSSLTDSPLELFYINCNNTSSANIFPSTNLENSIEVKIEYLKALPVFINNYQSSQFQEVLLQSFSSFFNESTMKIFHSKKSISNPVLIEFLDLLIKSPIYAQMNRHMANNIMPFFFNLASSFVSKWRFFDQCMLTYISLSDDHFIFFIEKFKPIIIDAMTRNTRPLTNTCIHLLSKMIVVSTNNSHKNTFFDDIKWIIENFSKSNHSDLRSFFINLCSSICFIIQINVFVENVWPYIMELTKDSSVSVIASLIKNLPKFRFFFRQKHEQTLDSKLVSTFHQIEYIVNSKLNKNKSEELIEDSFDDNYAARFDILNGNHISISDIMYLSEVINETRPNLYTMHSEIESELNDKLNHSAETFFPEKPAPLMKLGAHTPLKKRKSDIRPEVQLVKSSLPIIVKPSPICTKGGGKKSSLLMQKKGNYQRRLSLLSPKILIKH